MNGMGSWSRRRQAGVDSDGFIVRTWDRVTVQPSMRAPKDGPADHRWNHSVHCVADPVSLSRAIRARAGRSHKQKEGQCTMRRRHAERLPDCLRRTHRHEWDIAFCEATPAIRNAMAPTAGSTGRGFRRKPWRSSRVPGGFTFDCRRHQLHAEGFSSPSRRWDLLRTTIPVD